MARFLFIILAFFIAIQTKAFAQQQEQQKEEPPKTKLEAFSTQDGILLVREFKDTNAKLGRIVTVKALRIYEPGKEESSTRGLSIVIITGNSYSISTTAFVDYEEIKSLSDALGYMIETSNAWAGTQREYTEVAYLTKGDLKIGFYQSGKDMSAFITIGTVYTETAYIGWNQLSILKEAVDKGSSLLEENL